MIFLACVPLALPFLLLLGFKLNGLRTSLISSVVALAVALAFVPEPAAYFDLAVTTVGNAVAIGFGVLTVLFPGLLLYRLQERSGGLPVITALIRSQFSNPSTQVIALVIGVSPFIEAISGFGVSVLVVAPLFLALGYSPLKAGTLALVSQISVPLGALGVGTMIGAQLAGQPVNLVGAQSLLLAAPLPVIFALIALKIGGGPGDFRRFWPLAVTGGLAKTIGDYVFTVAFGIEVAGAIASLLAILVIFVIGKFYRNDAAQERVSIPSGVVAAVGPYVLLISALIITRGIAPIHSALANNFIINPFGAGFTYPLAYIPGFWVLLAALSVVVFNSITAASFWATLRATWKQFLPAGLTILFFLAIAQVMILSGMAATVARAGSVLGAGYIGIAPVLGALGGWLTGSNSGGNAMFVPLQVEASNTIGLPAHWTVAAQNAAASYGTMGSPARATLVAVTLADRSIEQPLLAVMIRYVAASAVVIAATLYLVLHYGV